MLYPHLHLILKARREHLKISIAELARQSDLSLSYISKMEHGERTITLDKLYQLAAALKLDFTTLLMEGGWIPQDTCVEIKDDETKKFIATVNRSITVRKLLTAVDGCDERFIESLVVMVEKSKLNGVSAEV